MIELTPSVVLIFLVVFTILSADLCPQFATNLYTFRLHTISVGGSPILDFIEDFQVQSFIIIISGHYDYILWNILL